MRILLVVPSRAYANVPGFTKFPDELLSIAGVLEAQGHEVRIHDQNLDKRQAKDFMDFKPQMVGKYEISPDKTLVTMDGHPVLGESGPIRLDGRRRRRPVADRSTARCGPAEA